MIQNKAVSFLFFKEPTPPLPMPLLCYLAEERSLTALQFGQTAEKRTEKYTAETVKDLNCLLK
jgi:hypothetical protein